MTAVARNHMQRACELTKELDTARTPEERGRKLRMVVNNLLVQFGAGDKVKREVIPVPRPVPEAHPRAPRPVTHFTSHLEKTQSREGDE